MGGTSKSQTTQSQQSTTNPWAPTMAPLNQIIGQISGQVGNAMPNAVENEALNAISANAQQGNPFAPDVMKLATDLFSGGPDRSGYATGAYDDYKAGAQPYLSQDYLDPYKNPAFKSYMDTTANDIQNRVNGMFAGAGRDFSGANMQTLARGITEGTAPIFANQYNQNVATQRGVADNLFRAGGSTAGLLSDLDSQNFANRGAGVAAAEQALQARDSGPMGILNAESLRRNLPLSGIANVANLLLPIAGLGGQTEGTGTSNTTNRMSGAQQFALISGGLRNLFPGQS